MDAGEYRGRQARAREQAAERGLGALIAVSRGGGTHDRVADALWLCALATPQPFVADLDGHWRGAGHVIVVVPVDGPVTAIVESEELCDAAIADDVVVATDLVAAAARALPAGRVGVLGADAVPHAWWAALEDMARCSRPPTRSARRCGGARARPSRSSCEPRAVSERAR